MESPANRRRYPRVRAPVFYRPAGPELMHHRRAAVNVSRGGMRVYSDDRLAVGSRLELELLLEGDVSARCWARVAWVEELPSDFEARFDIGFEFTDIADEDRTLLNAALSDF